MFNLRAMFVMVFLVVSVFAGVGYASDKPEIPGTQPSITEYYAGDERMMIEYTPSTLVGVDNAHGYGFGLAVTKLPYRVKLSYYHVGTENDIKEELDITTLNMSYRWKAYSSQMDGRSWLNFYIDGGADLGWQTGSRAEVINPLKDWDSPLSPSDVKKDNVSEFYWAGTAATTIEYVMDNAVTLGAYAEVHAREKTFVTLGLLFGVLF